MVEHESQTAGAADERGIAIRDEEGHLSEVMLAAVREALATADAGRLRRLADERHEADIADLLGHLTQEERVAFVTLLGDHFDFAVLTELDDTIRDQILEALPAGIVAAGVCDLESDDAVYILEDLEDAEQEKILAEIPEFERAQLRRSLEFPEDSAGRRMQSDVIAVPPFWTVGRTIDYMRESDDLPDEFYEIVVVDPSFRPIGKVALDRLLRSKRPVTIQDIMDTPVHTVRADIDQEEVARLFERYNLVSAAVVSDSDRLVGVITVDDIVDVIHEEAEEDIRGLAGIGDEEISDTVYYTARSRIPWLFVNLATAFVAAMVIGLFDASLQQMVALAILMPIVASLGGNAGMQAMTVTVRALATRELGELNIRRIFSRELLVAALNGVVIAILVGAAAFAWFGDPGLGAVIAIAMIINVLCAGLFGFGIPVVLNKMGADPAVSSSVFLTTVTDVVGFFAFLALATILLL